MGVGQHTVAEISDKVNVEVPAGAIRGTNAAVKAEVLGDEKGLRGGCPLLSSVVDVTFKNGTLTVKSPSPSTSIRTDSARARSRLPSTTTKRPTNGCTLRAVWMRIREP